MATDMALTGTYDEQSKEAVSRRVWYLQCFYARGGI